MTENIAFISQESHKAMLINALQIHGEQFMHSFNLTKDLRRERKRNLENASIYGNATSTSRPEADPEGSEDWFGMSTDECLRSYRDLSETNGTGSNLSENNEKSEKSSDTSAEPKLVVFTGSSSTRIDRRMLQPLSFMSSKVSKLSTGAVERIAQEFASEGEDYEQQKSHIVNDTLLKQLVHTRILNPSSNAEIKLKPSQKRKELAGRILELAGHAKPGKGESIIRYAEKKKAIRRIREGMERKRKQRDEKRLEEAKNTGDYHPIIKQLFNTSDAAPSKKRMRERGLKLGVGTFIGGVLKLRKDELASVQGKSSFVGPGKNKTRRFRS